MSKHSNPLPEARLLGAYWLDSQSLGHSSCSCACSCCCSCAIEVELPDRRPSWTTGVVLRTTMLGLACILIAAGFATVASA